MTRASQCKKGYKSCQEKPESRANNAPAHARAIEARRLPRAAGDFVLVEIAELLRNKLREGDIPCRYGGEELVMVMPGATKEITAARAESMRATIEKHAFVYQGNNLNGVTVSLGVAEYPQDGDTAISLMKAADMALYRAKDSGRNQVVLAGQ